MAILFCDTQRDACGVRRALAAVVRLPRARFSDKHTVDSHKLERGSRMHCAIFALVFVLENGHVPTFRLLPSICRLWERPFVGDPSGVQGL